MPWYRVYARLGPGHQTTWEDYRYSEKFLSSLERHMLWRQICGDWDSAIGKVKLVYSVPANVIEDKIAHYRATIKDSRRMLEILRERTISKPVIAVHFVGNWIPKKCEVSAKWEARLLARPEVTATGGTVEKAVNALCRQLRTKKKFYAVIHR